MRNGTIRVAKTKVMISFAVTAKLICAFVFAYADCWFSHEAAHLFTTLVNLQYIYLQRKIYFFSVGLLVEHKDSSSQSTIRTSIFMLI